jgi:hypothetical protein
MLILPTIYAANADSKVAAKNVQKKELMELTTIDGGKTITDYSDTMIIKNKSDSTLHSVRLMLSPDLENSFYLDRHAINFIEPNGNATVNIKLLGKPNEQVDGKVVGYNGYVMAMAAYHNPVLLPVSINSLDSSHQQAYMGKIAEMAHQRYSRTVVASGTIDAILSKLDKIEEHNFEVNTADGNIAITSATDQLVIRSLSEELLKNIRILVSKPSNIFLLDKQAIQSLEPNGEAVVHLISRIDGKNPHNGFKGEVIIAPVNGRPIVLPIDIPGNNYVTEDFYASTSSGSSEISKVVDKIVISNNGSRAMDGVRLILPVDLARVFGLSQDSFQSIPPNSEVEVDFAIRKDDNLMLYTRSFAGELVIVSAHDGEKIVIPINMVWKNISSDHFTIYYRDGEENASKAEQLEEFLESAYVTIAERFGELKSRTTIYMLGSTDEMRLITSSAVPYYYSYDRDIGFTASDAPDLEEAALHVLVYRSIMTTNPSYWNKQAILFDKGNWLVDGITNYLVASITGRHSLSNSGLDAFVTRSDLESYAPSTLRNYAVTYTFFRFLEETYGHEVIDRTLYHLGSGMISNHRCNTLENCSVLRGVYDAAGLDLDNKENKLAFNAIIEKWMDYLLEGPSERVIKETYRLQAQVNEADYAEETYETEDEIYEAEADTYDAYEAESSYSEETYDAETDESAYIEEPYETNDTETYEAEAYEVGAVDEVYESDAEEE